VRLKPALLARLPRAGSSKLTAGRSFRVCCNASSRLEFPKSVTYFGGDTLRLALELWTKT